MSYEKIKIGTKVVDSFCPSSRQEWRDWLQEHHQSRQSIWLVCYKVSTGVPSISWTEAVEEALCFGWIDSLKKTLDEGRFIQFYSVRKPKSTWSNINKDKVQQLIAKGLMSTAGLESIEVAKQNGSWTLLDEAEQLKIPRDLEEAFTSKAGSKAYFLSLSKSMRKSILIWILLARRSETRQNRIAETANLAAEQQKPKQFR